jgi:hypothetical protein
MKATLFLVATLLVGQAFAYDTVAAPSTSGYDTKAPVDKKVSFHFALKSASANYGNTFDAMTCSGHSYCFTQTYDKVELDPTCSKAGYTFDEKKNECMKVTGYSCGTAPNAKTCPSDKSKCYVCKMGEFVNKDNKCEQACKKGYTDALINGAKFCVEDCKTGETAMGQDCVAFDTCKEMSKCAKALCPGLLGGQMYFKKASGHGYSYTSAKDASKDSYSAYGAAAPTCVCAKTKSRDVYEKPACTDPKTVDAEPSILTCEAKCANSYEGPKAGKCGQVCPGDCLEGKDNKCHRQCPKGFKTCDCPFGKKFCATAAPLFGCDSCDVLCKMGPHMDERYMCKYVAPKPVVASPATKPAPKAPVVVVVATPAKKN